MTTKTGRYSKYIRPMSYIIDLLIIDVIGLVLFMDPMEFFTFVGFTNIAWIIMSPKTEFYEIYRYTNVVKIASLTILQFVIFTLIVFSFFGYFNKLQRTPDWIIKYLGLVFFLVFIIKLAVFYFLKKYRKILGGNIKNTIVVGDTIYAKNLRDFFINNPEYGFKFQKLFFVEKNKINLDYIFDYVSNNEVDEIYCSVGSLNNMEISKIVEFADNNMKQLKFIPDNKEIFTKKLDFYYYDITPILSLRRIPLEDSLKSLSKRFFDIVFSLFVICFVLSWLTPLLGLLIVLDTPGPVFFKQNRPGIKEKGFGCYKFRSMGVNSRGEDSATRNDPRVTKIGKFIRKTSIDELPQFINVLLGSMSVVGPRPHLWRQNEMYGTKVSKYMVRYFVKPGITGLAQVKGYRGEIETRNDIVNRTKYDIFYIENWSLLLDINIIIQTVLNIFEGEEKAY